MEKKTWAEQTPKEKAMGCGLLIVILVFIIILVSTCGGDDSKKTAGDDAAASQGETIVAKGVGLGEVLHTQYFDIVVNKVSVEDKIRTGNEFLDLPAEEGNRYLIIGVSFKNTDSESRMLVDGSLFIDYNGKQYEFDKSELVMAEGWGLYLDQINPLVTKTTKLVYKIPAEITGSVYWQPGRSDKDQFVSLGTI